MLFIYNINEVNLAEIKHLIINRAVNDLHAS